MEDNPAAFAGQNIVDKGANPGVNVELIAAVLDT